MARAIVTVKFKMQKGAAFFATPPRLSEIKTPGNGDAALGVVFLSYVFQCEIDRFRVDSGFDKIIS